MRHWTCGSFQIYLKKKEFVKLIVDAGGSMFASFPWSPLATGIVGGFGLALGIAATLLHRRAGLPRVFCLPSVIL